MTSDAIRVRQFQPGDLDDLYSICVQTADNGQDASHLFSDPRLPGHVFAAPYAIFEPALAFVAEDQTGVGGYIVAALDTVAFEQRLENEWWPGLRARYAEPSSANATDGMSTAERYARYNIHHPWGAWPETVERFPSHLHINLMPRLQGHGIGRELVETLAAALRARGSRGLHLLVGLGNKRAAEFYRHVGFTELPADEVRLFAMQFDRPS